MKIILLNGQFYTNPSNDPELGIVLPSTKAGLGEALKDTVKALCADRLKKSDWYLTRFVGTGKEIPEKVKEEREQIYVWCSEKEAEIDSLEYGELLKYDATA